MPDRRGSRFAVEALYLAALTAALAFSSLRPALIVLAMLCGWTLVAALEWTATARRPHYAAGLPPRWRTPAFALPPAQPLEQVTPAYPQPGVDEAATWIASAALREELLGEWPVLVDPEDTQEAPPEDWLVPLPEPEAEPEAQPDPVAPVVEVEVRMARYHVDPFAEPERGRFGKRSELPSIAVPAKPPRPAKEPGA